MSVVNVVCCVSRGLCDRPIPRPGESRRVCVCFIECDQQQQSLSTPTTSRLKGPDLKKKKNVISAVIAFPKHRTTITRHKSGCRLICT